MKLTEEDIEIDYRFQSFSDIELYTLKNGLQHMIYSPSELEPNSMLSKLIDGIDSLTQNRDMLARRELAKREIKCNCCDSLLGHREK